MSNQLTFQHILDSIFLKFYVLQSSYAIIETILYIKGMKNYCPLTIFRVNIVTSGSHWTVPYVHCTRRWMSPWPIRISSTKSQSSSWCRLPHLRIGTSCTVPGVLHTIHLYMYIYVQNTRCVL